MTRKGSKNFTESEKKLLISIINDYGICDLPDKKMLEILSQKLGRTIKETSYYTLKNEAKKSKSSPEQWLDNFCKSGIVEFYKERLEETLLVQKVLLRLYAEESNKQDIATKQDRFLITKISKAISDNSKNLSELGMSPIILAKLQSLIPKEVLNGNLEFVDKYFENMDKEQKMMLSGESIDCETTENNGREEIRPDPSKAPTAIFPPIEKKDMRKDGTASETATAQGDQPVF
jgi:hypothetical protein